MNILGLALLLALGFIVFQTLLLLHAVVTLTRPTRRSYAFAVARNLPGDPQEAGGIPFEAWTVNARNNTLPLWDIPGLDPGGPVIILSHGWGGSRIVELGRVEHLRPLASRLILWDMPGHGDAPGTSSLGAREHNDLDAIVRQLDTTAPVVLMGFSLGAGVSIHAAATGTPCAAVVAEAPYAIPRTPPTNALAAKGLPAGLSLRLASAWIGLRNGQRLSWTGDGGPFNRARVAADLTCPLLVLHGTDDPIVPIAEAHDIANAAPNARLIKVPGAGHTDLWRTLRADDERFAQLAEFIQQAASLTGEAAADRS